MRAVQVRDDQQAVRPSTINNSLLMRDEMVCSVPGSTFYAAPALEHKLPTSLYASASVCALTGSPLALRHGEVTSLPVDMAATAVAVEEVRAPRLLLCGAKPAAKAGKRSVESRGTALAKADIELVRSRGQFAAV